jgi:hypothetical protein
MPERSPDPWRILWQAATGDGALAILLLVTAASLALSAWIPQQPASDADYARWLSEAQLRFGSATPAMRSLGVFSITRSATFRVLLSLTAGCLLLRLAENVELLLRGRQVTEPSDEWTEYSGQQLRQLLDKIRLRRYRVLRRSSLFQVDRWPLARLLPLVAHVGGLLLLAGLLITRLSGWQVQGQVLQVGQRVWLPGVANWVELTEDGSGIAQSAGVVGSPEGEGPGVMVRAHDDRGRPLQVQLTAGAASSAAEPGSEVMIALTEDRYFAIPEASLVARLTPRSAEADSVVDVQVYRSPPGEIITETASERGGAARLALEGVIIELSPAPYMVVTATHNPGRVASAAGLLLLMVGSVGSAVWPAHTFWLREQDASIAAAGPVPPWLLRESA